MYAPPELVLGNFIHSVEYPRLEMNPGGGPDGTNVVLGVNSCVTNINCSGVGYSARVDIPEVLDWIAAFME